MIPELRYTDVEEELRASVRALLTDRCQWPSVLARAESDEPTDLKLWRTLAVELGLAGLAVPERHGGSGASFREAAVVLEELGRAVAPVPYLGSAVVATAALLACAATDLLADLASGARTAAFAVPFSTPPGAAVGAGVRAEGDTLSGTVTSVADAVTADLLIVPAAGGLYAVESSATGVTRTAVTSLDLTRPLCDLAFTGAPARRLAIGAAATAAVTTALTTGAALIASEQLGVAEWCLSSTVDYVRTRHQFARPIGSFQAVKHRLADLWVEVTQARAVARYAAAYAGEPGDPETPVAAALAKAYCSPVAVTAAEECVQLHGGIAFTWEHPAHLYLKRAKSIAIAFGTADRHREALAILVDLPAP